MIRSADISLRGNRLIVSTNWNCREIFTLGDWIEVVEEPACEDALGHLVRAALAESHDSAIYPDPDLSRRYGVLLKAANAHSAHQFVRTAYRVGVIWDDTGIRMIIEPFESDGQRFYGIQGQSVEVHCAVADAALGNAVRNALNVAARSSGVRAWFSTLRPLQRVGTRQRRFGMPLMMGCGLERASVLGS